MKTIQEQELRDCLEVLSKFTKEQLLEEIEQLLLSKLDKGESLLSLKHFFSKGGCRQSLKQ